MGNNYPNSFKIPSFNALMLLLRKSVFGILFHKNLCGSKFRHSTP